MAWRAVNTIQDATTFLEVMERTDPDMYRYSKVKGSLEHHSAGLLRAITDESQPTQAWLYEDGDAAAALKIAKKQNPETLEWRGRIVTFCAVGFAPDLYDNWKTGFPVINQKARELFDAWEIKDYYGETPRTENGEMLAYFASAYCWEAKGTKLNADNQAYRIDMQRDGKLKPQDEARHDKAFKAAVLPDALPATVLAAEIAEVEIHPKDEKLK